MEFVVDHGETPRRYHNLDRLTLLSKTNSIVNTMTVDMPIQEFTLKKGDMVHVRVRDVVENEDDEEEEKDQIIFNTILLHSKGNEITYSASGLFISLVGFSINQLRRDNNGVEKNEDENVAFVFSRISSPVSPAALPCHG